MPYPAEQHCSLLSYAAPYCPTLHPTELCRTLLSKAPPYWAMPLPTLLRCTPLSYATLDNICCILLCYAAPWAMPHPTVLRCTPLSYAALDNICCIFYYATPHPELCRTLLCYAVPHWAMLHSTIFAVFSTCYLLHMFISIEIPFSSQVQAAGCCWLHCPPLEGMLTSTHKYSTSECIYNMVHGMTALKKRKKWKLFN
jgi:hypothetical protein